MSQSTISIRVASTADEARAALADGYEPVECAFGGESVVGPLGLDHHGSLSGNAPVCGQAESRGLGHIGASLATIVDARRYVVAGAPDADASLCIAILEAISEDVVDITSDALHEVVGLVSGADLGHWADLSAAGRAGAIILAWHARQRARGFAGATTPERWVAAVQDWAELFALRFSAPELLDVGIAEAERVRLARDARVTADIGCADGATVCTMRDYSDRLVAGHPHGIALIESPVMGADVWYADHPQLRGYVAWQAESRRISISLRPGTAMGDGLLTLLRPSLAAVGAAYDSSEDSYVSAVSASTLHGDWGGRPEIIGSPRGVAMTREDAVHAVGLLAARINEVARG